MSYYYDQTSYNGLTISNGKGHRTGMSDGSGQTAWSYDTMGRIVTEQRTIGTVTKTISYSYNLDGSLASITYPSGRVVSYTYGNDGRPVSAVDSANSINYAKSATYAPQGRLASTVNGYVSGGFAGITTSNSYNNRLLPTVLSASSSNGTALSLSYSYFANGNVNVETNGRDNGRSVTYTYDALNRVSTATSQATSGSDCWGQSFGYDRYANLTMINVTQCTALMMNLSVNTNNQIASTGFSYDAAGDLTSDGVYTYSWNAEQHLSSAANVIYTYDGNLNRVKKSSGTLYWNSSAGVPLAETDSSGNTLNEYVFFGAARLARRDASGNVYYYFEDHLGTTTTLSNSSGVLCYDADFLPFGSEMTHTATCLQNYKFTGLERDSETGLDHTRFRKYDWSLGRWLTPDPKAGNAANPQSWNRYTYVLNNPTGHVDPVGLDLCPPGCVAEENQGGEDCECPVGGSGGGGGGRPCAAIVMAGHLLPMEGNCGGHHSSGGGGSGPSLSALLAAAVKRVSADLQKPGCAKDFDNPTACQAELSNVKFGDLKQLEFVSTQGGDIVPAPGSPDVAIIQGTAITLNTQVNWSDPNQTAALLNGQPWTYPALVGEAQSLNVQSVTASQFMDIYILHELEHYSQKLGDPDDPKVEQQLWKDCIQ